LTLWLYGPPKAECGQSDEDPGCTLDDTTEENMRALIDLAFQETNEAFAASGVDTTVRLVHAYTVPDRILSRFGSRTSH
jgi:hypothetical protein